MKPIYQDINILMILKEYISGIQDYLSKIKIYNKYFALTYKF